MTTCRSFAQLGQNCKQPRLMRKMMKEAGAVLKAFVVVFRNNVDDLPLLTAGGSLGAAVLKVHAAAPSVAIDRICRVARMRRRDAQNATAVPHAAHKCIVQLETCNMSHAAYTL